MEEEGKTFRGRSYTWGTLNIEDKVFCIQSITCCCCPYTLNIEDRVFALNPSFRCSHWIHHLVFHIESIISLCLPGTLWLCGSSFPPPLQPPARLEGGLSLSGFLLQKLSPSYVFIAGDVILVLYVCCRLHTTTIMRDSAQHCSRRKSPILTW